MNYIPCIEKRLCPNKYTIYSAIFDRRICAGYARFGAESHLDRHEALSYVGLSVPNPASPALRLYSVSQLLQISIKLLKLICVDNAPCASSSMDRATDFGSVGCRFDSCLAQFFKRGFFKIPSFILLALPAQCAGPADSTRKRAYAQSISPFPSGTPCTRIDFASF